VLPKIAGKPPKWMVKIMENPIEMDDLGGPPLFSETPTFAWHDDMSFFLDDVTKRPIVEEKHGMI